MASRRQPESDPEPDPDVIITDRGTIRVLRRKGETEEDYLERLHAARPPLNERQKEVIRTAGREYWAAVRERRRKPEAEP
jgi:hypothetical protein